AHEAGLARGGAGRLYQVVLPARAADAGEEGDGAQRQVAEEGADDGDVRPVSDLEDDVGIRTPDERGDRHRGGDGAEGELAAVRRRRGSLNRGSTWNGPADRRFRGGKIVGVRLRQHRVAGRLAHAVVAPSMQP